MERSLVTAALREVDSLLAAIDPLKVWAIVATLSAIILVLLVGLLVWMLRVRQSRRPLRYVIVALDLIGAIGLVVYAIRTYMAYQQAHELLLYLPFSAPFTLQEAQSHLAAYVAPYQQAGWILVGITVVLLVMNASVAIKGVFSGGHNVERAAGDASV